MCWGSVTALENTTPGTASSSISDSKNKLSATITQTEVIDAATRVKKFTEDNKRLPSKILVGNTPLNLAQFLHLSTDTIVVLNQHQTTDLVLSNDTLPPHSQEQVKKGSLTRLEYVKLARNLSTTMDISHQAPPNSDISLGKIGFQSQIYLYSRILTYYQQTKTLPASTLLRSWSYYTTVKYTPYQIITAAITTNNFIEANKRIPSYVNIDKQQISMAQLLHLMTSTVINLNQKNSKNVILKQFQTPTNSSEKLNSGRLNKKEYLDLAQQIITSMEIKGSAPQCTDSRLGQIGFKSLIYTYTRILSWYDQTNQLPIQVYLKTWDSPNIPIANQPITFQHQQVIDAALFLKNYQETNKTLPSRVKVGTEYVNITQFLHLMTSTIHQLDGKKEQPLVLFSDRIVPDGQENMIYGTITKSSYLDFIDRIETYLDSFHKSPTFTAVGIGYESQLYLSSTILYQYQKFKILPQQLWLKSLKPVVLIGTNKIGKVERLGPFGNLSSPVKIVLIVGMHPLENMSHQAMIDSVKAYSSSFNYCYYLYRIMVTLNANDYDKGRLNGQLLAREYIVNDLISHKYDLAVDVHSNRGKWAQKRFVFCPVAGTTGQSIANYLVKKISWLKYYIPPNPTSPSYMVIPAIKGGIPSICHEIYIADDYSTSRIEQSLFLKTLDAMKF